MARLGAFDKTYSQRGWFDATYGDPVQGWLDATAIGLQGTEAVTAYGVWIQYSFLSGAAAAIGYRQPTFVTLVAGEHNAPPRPTSQSVRVPVATPTLEAPPQGPTPQGSRVAAPAAAPAPRATEPAPTPPTPTQGPTPKRRS